ncbi:ATP-binding cassette subfamily B protein [Litorivivens lipolytica]|uniref:ATP-binding cassette subfamily B protein n=1 Tax=Litorivivens lipolytica TaxID=1524264 RepID=A0A7W4W6H6_9GAMM|nr:ABC transporter transmembrane domain-containing protein [Litorivivens lipolytica]MBB3047742.1 ATP-binding cassette subfamily B protein [Litorivivens lipolytica]
MADVNENRDPSKNIGVLKAMLQFLRPYKAQVVGASIALVFTATITLSIGQGIRLLVDEGFASGTPAMLNHALLVFMGLVFLLAVGTFTRFYLVSWIGERVSADIRKAVFDHVITLHPGFFETNLSGEIQSRITTDTTLLQTVIGSSVSIALRNALMFVGGIVWLIITNPKLTGMVLLSVPLIVVPILVFGRRVRALSRSSQDSIASVGSFVGEAIKNIKVLQAFNYQERDKALFGRHVEEAFQIAIRRINQRAWLSTAVILLVLGAIAAMLWVGGHDVLAGRISAGELAAFVFYALMVAASVGAISEVYGDLQRAAGATERLLELLAARSLIVPPEQPLPLPAMVQGELQMKAVCFAYPSRPDYLAINNLTLDVPAGSSMALVGSSGAGKSTLVDLLLRFYDVQGGSITFDGVELRDLSPETLRAQIALVPQQPVLFTGTVADNIRYGNPDASEAQMIEAAKAAYAHEFIERLPEGYESFVGEGGVRLSGGQRQRIAIARAILKDPKLLLLDEATSALDAESEFQVQQALQRLMKDRTTIVIAHRLATVVKVDKIAVLDHGQLAALGSHGELIKNSPLYARWASLQFDHADDTPTSEESQ